MSIEIHNQIRDKLKYFHEKKKIPNIIFYGPSGAGKSTIVNEFIHTIYNNDKEQIKNFVMNVNCAHGRGIKFIREELKFFAKTHIISNGGDVFKSVVLLNGDKLTMDAQSALRRCIELFSHNTRFFIIVEDKYKLLKPILSRFCEIYISEPTHNGELINLYRHNIDNACNISEFKNKRFQILKKELQKYAKNNKTETNTIEFIVKLYEKAYSALDVVKLLEEGYFDLTEEKRYEILIAFSKVKKEFRNEKLLLLFILNFVFLDKLTCLEELSYI